MTAIPGKKIFLEQIKSMFFEIEKKSGWDLHSDMRWGYFFLHENREPLEKAKIELEIDGYKVVEIFASDPEADEFKKFLLHVEKTETHSSESLDKRNDELYLLASKFDIQYDGMDVGPINED